MHRRLRAVFARLNRHQASRSRLAVGATRRLVAGMEQLEDRQLLSHPGSSALPPEPQPTDAAMDTATPDQSLDTNGDAGTAGSGGGAEEGLWRTAVFDQRKFGTLGFSFTRDVNTVDRDGLPVERHQPRFGPDRAIVETNQWSLVHSSFGNLNILGSGWDHDGTTPLAVVQNQTSSQLIFFRGDALDVQNTVELRVQGSEDLMGASVEGFRYLPRSAMVHEGLVVFQAQRDRREGNTWVPEGVSFVWTQDYGETFTRVAQVGGGFDVPAIEGGVSDGIDRGRRWAFSNPFPERSADDLLGAWFPWADYLHKSGKPKGGQVGMFRARRPAVGETWVVEPNRLAFERWEAADSGGFHAHSTGMFVDGLVSFWGDVGYRNLMARHTCNDMENYTECEFTTLDTFQGGWSPDDGKVYRLGNQAASTAPGPLFGQVLVTGDEQHEVVMRIERPDGANDKAIITNLKGAVNGQSSGSGYDPRLSLWIHYLRGKGYVVRETDASPGFNTNHYSLDGEHWASMVTSGPGTTLLYGDRFLQVSGSEIFAADLPGKGRIIQPLIVNPGGLNLSNGTWHEDAPPQPGCSFRAVVIDGEMLVYADDGTPVAPQPNALPPVVDGMPIWEVTTDAATTDCGRRVMTDIDVDQTENYWLTMWHYSLNGDGIDPSFKFGTTGASNQTPEKATRWLANSHWVPSFVRGTPSGNPSNIKPSVLWVFSGLDPGPRRWLMAGESFVAGTAPTYALPPGEPGPNELAGVDEFQTGPDWTVALTFGLPQVSAFSSRSDPEGNETARPIATLLESDSERAEVYYTKANRTFWIDVFANNFLIQKLIFPDVYLDTEDKVNLVISSNETEFGATLQVMRDAYPITHQVQTSNGSIQLNRISFSNKDRTVVTPMEWYAVQVNESVALDSEARAAFIDSDRMFSILDVGFVLGDMDIDGDLDLDDIDEFLLGIVDPDAYEDQFGFPPSANGDMDGDGDLDLDDTDGFVALIAGLPVHLVGDMDLDGEVDLDDVDDFVLALTNGAAYEETFGVAPKFNGDINGDGRLDLDDVAPFVDRITGSPSTEESTAGSGSNDGSGSTTGSGSTAGSGSTTGSGSTAGSGSTTGSGFAASSEPTDGSGATVAEVDSSSVAGWAATVVYTLAGTTNQEPIGFADGDRFAGRQALGGGLPILAALDSNPSRRFASMPGTRRTYREGWPERLDGAGSTAAVDDAVWGVETNWLAMHQRHWTSIRFLSRSADATGSERS